MRDSRRMEFWITIIGLARRTRVIIPVLLIAVALGAAAYSVTPTSYVSSTTMVLTTTKYGGTLSRDPTKPPDLTNPMLNFNDSLTTTSAIFIAAMNTKAVDRQLGATGSTQLIVDDGRTNPALIGLNGPFLYIVGKSTSPGEAKRIVLDARTMLREKVQDWQRALNAPEKTYVSLADVVPPSAPKPDRARATKYAMLGFIFGFALFLGIAYLFHQRRRRRLARKAAQVAAADAPQPPGRTSSHSGRPARPTRGPGRPQPSRTPADGREDPPEPRSGGHPNAGARQNPRGGGRPGGRQRETSALPPGDRPRPDPGPSSALTPSGVAEVDVGTHSALIATPPRGEPEHTAEATYLNGATESAVPSSRNKKDQPVFLRVPVKLKTRSRNS